MSTSLHLRSAAPRAALLSFSFVLLATPGASQQAGGPIARYSMDAGTMSGMAAMAGGGGMGGAMSMMMGGGNQPIHELVLRLGSTQAASGSPAAEHYMPAGARLGASVPLVTPKVTPSDEPALPGEKPRGGCSSIGDAARPPGRTSRW
jgi:hypothetical protein